MSKSIKKSLCLLFFLFQSVLIFGQKGYFKTDSTISIGVKFIDGGAIQNAIQCQIEEKKKIFTFSPYEVTEYGFSGKIVYVSRSIKVNNAEQRVFLERLKKGKINLLYYRFKNGKSFFIEKDSILVEIVNEEGNKQAFRNILEEYANDCNNVTDALKLVKYNKRSLTLFIDQYNSCTKRQFPVIRYGLFLGLGAAKPVLADLSAANLDHAEFNNDIFFNAGLFLDVPVINSPVSFHPEICFQKNGYVSYSESNNSIDEIIINTTSVNVPLLLRYTYPVSKLRPFINAGGIFASSLKNNNGVYKTTVSNNIIVTDKLNSETIFPRNQYGIVIGGGFQFSINYKRFVSLELRYNKLYSAEQESFGNRSIQLLAGLNF